MKSKSDMIEAFKRAGIKPWSKYIEYLIKAKQFSGATDLDAYLEAYRREHTELIDPDHPGHHEKTPEELCQISNTPPRVIIGHIAAQLWEVGTPEGNVLQALNHVDIIETWIEQAKKPEGFLDRREFLRANGVIPIPSNQTIHHHKHFGAAKTIEGQAPGTLPSFEDDLVDDDLPLLPPPSEKP